MKKLYTRSKARLHPSLTTLPQPHLTTLRNWSSLSTRFYICALISMSPPSWPRLDFDTDCSYLLALRLYWSSLSPYFFLSTPTHALSSPVNLPLLRPCFRTHSQASGRRTAAFVPTKNGVSNTGGSKSGVFVPGAFSPKSRKELKQGVKTCTTSSSGSSTGLVYTNPPKRTVAYDRVLLPSAVRCVGEW